MLRTGLLAALAVLATATACGSGSSSTPGSPAPTTTSLTFVVRPGNGAAVKTVRLRCPATDTAAAPARRQACAALAKIAPAVFLPVPKDTACSMLYGGPQTARVTGTYRGKPVSAAFTRTNGCETARWGELQTVLTPLGIPSA